MPEGDTVWRACRRLHELLAGEQLTRAEFRVPQLAVTDLTGVTVLDVTPRGKHQLFRFDNGWTLHTHFRMDGAWRIYPSGRSWSGGPDREIRAVLGTRPPMRWAIGCRWSSCCRRRTRTTWSGTSVRTCSARTGTGGGVASHRGPTGHARSARHCSTSATSPASARSTGPSCCFLQGLTRAPRCPQVANLPRVVQRAQLLLTRTGAEPSSRRPATCGPAARVRVRTARSALPALRDADPDGGVRPGGPGAALLVSALSAGAA